MTKDGGPRADVDEIALWIAFVLGEWLIDEFVVVEIMVRRYGGLSITGRMPGVHSRLLNAENRPM